MNPSNINLQNTQGLSHEPSKLKPAPQSPQGANFKEMLAKKLENPVQFSKHAALRLNDRNINLTGEQMERVEDAVQRADAKGIRDSLVLVDDLALVVNVKSKTVITALQNTQENVFSNIDGAVIV